MYNAIFCCLDQSGEEIEKSAFMKQSQWKAEDRTEFGKIMEGVRRKFILRPTKINHIYSFYENVHIQNK